MNFASDNTSGVCAEVLEALIAEASIFDAAYGMDQASENLRQELSEIFERQVRVFPVATGTAANSISLASQNPVWGSVMCHSHAHIQVDECAAPTAIGGGLTLDPVEGPHGLLTPQALQHRIDTRRDSGVHTVALTGLSITQSTEAGTVYTASEIGDLCEFAKSNEMATHLDGARFANAVAATGSSPAELTWKAGVNLMSLGATKGGALAADAIVAFDDTPTETIERIRKRFGHLFSKQRLASAQMLGWLGNDAWLNHAKHANNLAGELAEGLEQAGVEIVHPVQTNMVFALLEPTTHERLQAAGAQYYTERAPNGLLEARLVVSWSTTASDVLQLLGALDGN